MCIHIIPSGTQLPLCSDQCSELNSTLAQCRPELESALDSNLTAPLVELLQYVTHLNCAQPATYLLPHVLVDEEECGALMDYCKA